MDILVILAALLVLGMVIPAALFGIVVTWILVVSGVVAGAVVALIIKACIGGN